MADVSGLGSTEGTVNLCPQMDVSMSRSFCIISYLNLWFFLFLLCKCFQQCGVIVQQGSFDSHWGHPCEDWGPSGGSTHSHRCEYTPPGAAACRPVSANCMWVWHVSTTLCARRIKGTFSKSILMWVTFVLLSAPFLCPLQFHLNWGRTRIVWWTAN